MKNIFAIVVCVTLFGCEAVATLFHGDKPEPPTVTYTITFDANGATGNPPAERTVTEGDVIKLPNIGGMVHSGNTFVGWSESATIGVGTTLFVEDSVTVTRDMVFYAQWVPLGSTQYTISFNANDASGAPPSSKIVYAGVQIIIPDKGSLAYAGKMFGGWNTEKDGSGTLLGAGTLYTVSGSITLYAQWYSSTDSFTVTFHANGGSGDVPSPQTVTASSNITLPNGNGLSKDGFIFGGWNTNAAGTGSNYAAGYLYTVTGTITLYAKWNSFFASVTEVGAYLAAQSGGYDPDEPVYLPVEINLGNMTQNGSGWRQLLNIVASSGKYVDLDLSACTMTGTEFNPDNNVATGKDMIVSITLPDTAARIADGFVGGGIGTFRYFTELKSISGAGLTSIGDYAFMNCASLPLTRLLAARLTSIGDYAFMRCTNLALTELPAGLTFIGVDAFMECTNLALTSLPAGLTSIGAAAFMSCTNLALTSLPTGLTSIGGGAFDGCTNLALTSLPMGLTTIGASTFGGCSSLTQITLPAGITSIGYSAFYNCTSLTSLTLPASVNLDFSNSNHPFQGCTSLASFTVTGSGHLSVIEGGKALVRNNTELSAYPTASGNVSLSAGLTSIGNGAFCYNNSLNQITLPEGITSIGDYAFYGCTNLRQITLPASLTSIGEWACIGGHPMVVICLAQTPPMSADRPFNDDSGLSIKVPAGSVEAYKAAYGWSVYADRISAIE